MAKNDTVLLDGIIEERIQQRLPSEKRDEVFEFFAFEQVLKDFDLSIEETEFGWVDGRDDGGIDGFFIFVNGHLLTDPESFPWPKRNAELTVFVLTCKHHDTFQQGPLDTLAASITELLDFGIDSSELRGAYSDEIRQARSLLFLCYRRLSSVLVSTSIRYIYASRGDSLKLGASVKARSEQIREKTATLFSSSLCEFQFLGSSELIDLYRRVRTFSLELPFLEFISHGSSNIVLARLEEYNKIVRDPSGELRRYLFDANVRDYLGENRVNEDIARSLKEPSSTDFWWLNNGITILTTSARVVGKSIQMDDVQIVNGLQTTETIHRFFAGGGRDSGRSVLIKIISSEDPAVRDKIIRATNNQSLVELTSLHSTDRIQRDIEAILERGGWFYERRKNYHRNIGKPASHIVTPLYVASGSICLLMKNPVQATKLKARFMRNEEAYAKVFSTQVPLEVWPKLVSVLKQTELLLEPLRPVKGHKGERFLASWRSLVAFMTVSRLLGRYSFSPEELIQLEVSKITKGVVSEIWEVIVAEREGAQTRDSKSQRFVDKCCKKLSDKFGTKDPHVVGKHSLPVAKPENSRRKFSPPVQLIDQVDKLLPKQPWKPGVHHEIAAKLSCESYKVSAAITALIESGKWSKQTDGVVYDAHDNILCFDPDRQGVVGAILPEPDKTP